MEGGEKQVGAIKQQKLFDGGWHIHTDQEPKAELHLALELSRSWSQGDPTARQNHWPGTTARGEETGPHTQS